MKIGQKVATFTNNLVVPFVLGRTKKGTTVEIPAGVLGKIVEKLDNIKVAYSVCVQFNGSARDVDATPILVYMNPKFLKVLTQ